MTSASLCIGWQHFILDCHSFHQPGKSADPFSLWVGILPKSIKKKAVVSTDNCFYCGAITGDPAGLARSTQTEDGVNNYTIILSNMNNPILRAQKKLLNKQPPQVARLEFVNSLFEGYDGWEILIDMRCRKFTEDLVYQKKNADGTKNKSKVTDPKSGVKYEKYGHLSDCFDYALCLCINESWQKFRSSRKVLETTATPIYGTFNY